METPTLTEMKVKIDMILSSSLPEGVNFKTILYGGMFDTNYMKIGICLGEFETNNPTYISLSLSDQLELKFQIYGGNGGQCITRNIDPKNVNESYLSCKREKISFRTPLPTEKSVLKAIESICIKYVNTIQKIADRNLLIKEYYQIGGKYIPIDYSSVLI